MLQRIFLISFLAGFAAAAAFGETYKTPFARGCGEVWPAVKTALADKDHYAKVVINDEKMKADFQPKHTVHVDISGTLLQRMNHMTLLPKDGVCEMEVVSNYSGWGHNDEGDFRKRVADNLAKGKTPGTEPPAPAGSGDLTAKPQ
jgi:hypothetical protein